MQDAEVRPWIDRVKDRWKTWLVVLIVAIVGIYYLSGRNSAIPRCLRPWRIQPFRWRRYRPSWAI